MTSHVGARSTGRTPACEAGDQGSSPGIHPLGSEPLVAQQSPKLPAGRSNRSRPATLHTVYKVVNLINGHVYIGMHSTSDLADGYMGSGRIIRSALRRYGAENFTKDVLFVFGNKDDMQAKEAELVTPEWCARQDTYNLLVGGLGGFSYINATGRNWNPERLPALAKGRRTQSAMKESRVNAYQLAPKRCATCNAPLGYGEQEKKFCNSWCAAVANNRDADCRLPLLTVKLAATGLAFPVDGVLFRRVRDWLLLNISCARCGCPLEYSQRPYKFCGYSCSSTHKNLERSRHGRVA